MAKSKATHGGDDSPPALSTESVFEATKEVAKWKELCSSSCGFKIPRGKFNEIEADQQLSTAKERKKAAISFWLEYDPAPSWRRLIVGLDEIEAHQVAEKIRKYAEPLRESTLTRENVLEVLQSVPAKKWDDLAFALQIPISKRDQIEKQFRTPEQRREALVTYWLQVGPNASWEMLAGALYFWEKNIKAVEATKDYLPEFKDRTLTLDNLCELLEEVQNLNDLGLYLHVPNSKRPQFGRNHRSLLKHWLKTHPFPSWQLVGEALFRMEESSVLKEVQNKYLFGSIQSRKAFEDAMKNGFIESVIGKLLTIGAAGAGKTSSKHVILDEDPPTVRKSTPCALRPVKLIRVTTEGEKWRRLDIKDLQNTIAGACHRVHTLSSAVKTPDPGKSAAAGNSTEESQMRSQQNSNTSNKEKKTKTKHERRNTIPDMPHRMEEDGAINPVLKTLLDSSSTEADLMKLIDQSSRDKSTRSIPRVERVHFTDSGGQPQFHEVLPVFLRRTTGCLFVLKLSEELDQHPIIEYYDENGVLLFSIPSAHSNLQILRHCIRSIYSYRSQKGQGKAPRLVTIGTYKDEEHKCKETRKAKNQRLSEILLPDFQDEVVYCDETMKEFIFALNAKCPGPEEKRMAEYLRQLIIRDCLPKTPDKIPIHWYALELKLQEIAQALGRQVLTKDECFQAAERLQFDSHSFEAALQYLDSLSIIFYYPDILPNVVFCDPQVLLDKVTELVEFNYKLRENPDPQSPIAGDRRKFRDYGFVTVDFLSNFQKHYVNEVFHAEQLVELFHKLLLLADFTSEHRYFMPCLLKTLDDSEEAEYYSLHSSSSSPSSVPLVFDIKPYGPLNGLFCSLVTFLLSCENTHPCPWNLHVDQLTGDPKCLYRNCVKFSFTRKPGVVTLVDCFKFKFFVVLCDESVRPKLFPHIREAVLKGLEKAATTLHYNNIDPQLAFICKCSESIHLATLSDEKSSLICTISRAELKPTLDENQEIWLDELAPFSPASISSPQPSTSPTTMSEAADLLSISPPHPGTSPITDSEAADSLTESDISEISEYLHTLDKTHFFELGLCLGLRYSSLKDMLEIQTYRADVIAAWIRKEGDVEKKTGIPTWRTLVKALRNCQVRQEGIASVISIDKNITIEPDSNSPHHDTSEQNTAAKVNPRSSCTCS